MAPGIPPYAKARAKHLGLPDRSAFFALIIHNYLNNPRQLLPVIETPPRLVKVKMQLSLPASLRAGATRAAKRWGLSLSALVESLVLIDADSGEDGLQVNPVLGLEKPELDYP